MIRTQISLDATSYRDAKRAAREQGISLAEFFRRALASALAPSRQQRWKDKPWMTFAGMLDSGNPRSSESVDEVVYGRPKP